MNKRGRPRKPRKWVRLIYDGIVLVPVEPHGRHSGFPDSWHLPGGEKITTKALVQRAESRGIALLREECDGTSTRLSVIT